MPLDLQVILQAGIVGLPYRKDPDLIFYFHHKEFRTAIPDVNVRGCFVSTATGTFSTSLEAHEVIERVVEATKKQGAAHE